MIFRKQRSGSRATVFHDPMGRDYLVREFLASEVNHTWQGRVNQAAYDRAGRPVLRHVSVQVGSTWNDALRRDVRSYTYDTAGRVTGETWRPDGTASGTPSIAMAYGYDLAGNRTTMTWPGTWTATYAYDAANRPQTVTFPATGGNRTATIAHNSLSQRTSVARSGTSANTTYSYAPDGDLTGISHAFVPGSGPGPVSFAYGRDASGKVTTVGISQPAFEWMPTLAYARSYGVANNLNQMTSAAGVAIGWNADGNMTSDGVTTFGWTHGNRLVSATRSGMTATYDYDSDDRRTKKVVNGTMTRTLWSGADEIGELNQAGTILRRFVPDGTGAMDARLATVESNGTVYWHHTDHQGSVIATSLVNGQTAGTASYSPHGEFSASITAPPLGSPFGYTGRQFDPETGLYQYRARYFSPKLGIFLSTDPIGTQDDPNLYMYVGLDPVNYVDPTGEQVFVSGQYDRAAGPMGRVMDSALARYRQEHPDRSTWLRRHNDREGTVSALREAHESGLPVIGVCHSRGCNTLMHAIEDADIPVSLLVTLDAVAQNDMRGRLSGDKPEQVSAWVAVFRPTTDEGTL